MEVVRSPTSPLSQVMSAFVKPELASDKRTVSVAVSPSIIDVSEMLVQDEVGAAVSTAYALLVSPDSGALPALSVHDVPTTQVLDAAVVLAVGVKVPVQVTPSLATEIEANEPLAQTMSAFVKAVTASERTTVTVAVSPAIRDASPIATEVTVGSTPSMT